MAIEIAVVGTGAFAGARSNITTYSVEEAITPLDASQPSPGVGSITFGATESTDSTLLLDNEIELRDGARGITSGTIRSVTSGDVALTVTADSILSYLMAERVAQPFAGTLEGLITYYLSLVNVTTDFEVSPSIAARPVVVGGWNNSVLSALSDLCVAQQVELSVVYDKIVFRPARSNTAITRRQVSTGWSIDRGNPALSVSAYEYNYATMTNGIVYPSPLETFRDGGFQVDIGESLEPTRIDISASLSLVYQPVVVNSMGPNYTGTTGQYVVLGSDDLPIPAAEWTAKGGKLTASIDPEDPNVLIINVTGMTQANDPRAPYRVGVMSSGGGTYYGALYITGTGVSFDKQLFTVMTGATTTQVEEAPPIDNPMLSTRAQVLTAIQKAVRRYSGERYTITGEAVSVNREGAGNEFATSFLQAFNDEFSGDKLQALNDRNWKFADFDAFFASLVTDQFDNQLFGNAGGARVKGTEAWFRISNASTTQESVSYTAEIDTLWGDWDLVWSGDKLAAWDAAFAGHKLRDWDIKPLKEAA